MKEIKQEIIKSKYLVQISNDFLDKLLSGDNLRKNHPKSVTKYIDEILETHTTVLKLISATNKSNIVIVLWMVFCLLVSMYFNNNVYDFLCNYWWLLIFVFATVSTLLTNFSKLIFCFKNFRLWKIRQLYFLSQIISEIPVKYLIDENNNLTLNFENFLKSEEYKEYGLFAFKEDKLEFIIKKMKAYSKIANYFKIKYKINDEYKYTRVCEFDELGKIIDINYDYDEMGDEFIIEED